MKYFALTILVITLMSCSSTPPQNNAVVGFESLEHNFNSLPYKKEAEYNFQFTNPGKTPLVIFDVKTSCGCTIPDWTKKPINPGKNGEIKIKYDAAFPGVFHKTITIYYNGVGSPDTLTIKGEVDYPDYLEAKNNE